MKFSLVWTIFVVFMSFEETKAAPEWPTKDGGSVGTYPTKAGPWDGYPTKAGPWDDYPTKAGPWDDYPTKAGPWDDYPTKAAGR